MSEYMKALQAILLGAKVLGITEAPWLWMIELDPKYADTILERWETFTGEKAKMVTEYGD